MQSVTAHAVPRRILTATGDSLLAETKEGSYSVSIGTKAAYVSQHHA